LPQSGFSIPNYSAFYQVFRMIADTFKYWSLNSMEQTGTGIALLIMILDFTQIVDYLNGSTDRT